MTQPSLDVTDAELAVLELLWQCDSATIRDLREQLYPGGGAAHYGTVQKLLDRLEAKRYVGRERSRVPHHFHAVADREQLIGHRLQDLADRLCAGSVVPLLSQLVDGQKLSRSDRDALRRLVDDLDDDPGGLR